VFLFLGFLYGLALLLCSLGFAVPTTHKTLDTQSSGQDANHMLKQPVFYITYAYLAVSAAIGLAIVSDAVPMARAAGVSVKLSAAAPGLISVCNGLGRLLFGFLFDKRGRTFSMLVLTGGMVFASGIFIIVFNAGLLPLLGIGYIILGLSFGGVPLLSTMITNKLFGQCHYSLNVSIMGTHGIVGSLSGPLLAGFIYNHTQNYQTNNIFFLLLSFCSLAAVIGLKRLVRRP
jgi:OFA family oxalate/formate antiporter-like MFS transporter